MFFPVQDSRIENIFLQNMIIPKINEYKSSIELTQSNMEKTVEGKILDTMGLTKICCRRHMLTHVDIE